MTWSDDWLPGSRTALIQLRGEGTTSPAGTVLPRLSIVDAQSVLALMTRGVIASLGRSHWAIGGLAAVAELYVDSDSGELTGPTSGGISAEQYLRSPQSLAPPESSDTVRKPWYRSPGGGDISTSSENAYTIYDPGASIQQATIDGTVHFRRQLVSDWQSAIDMLVGAAHTTAEASAPMQDGEMRFFWAAIERVAVALDTLDEVPPPTPALEQIRAAAERAATEIGDLAAGVANEAGQIAGNVVSGALRGIGVMGVAVLALVVFLAFKL